MEHNSTTPTSIELTARHSATRMSFKFMLLTAMMQLGLWRMLLTTQYQVRNTLVAVVYVLASMPNIDIVLVVLYTGS